MSTEKITLIAFYGKQPIRGKLLKQFVKVFVSYNPNYDLEKKKYVGFNIYFHFKNT